MRLRLLTALGVTALALAAPGAALAGHGHRDARDHHHHHGAEHHHALGKAHHANVHFVHLGPTPITPVVAGGAPQPPVTPPATPANAATVASYTGGVLTLTLTDGSSVSGKVTNATAIRCLAANPPVAPPGEGQQGDRGPGDDNGQGDDRSGDDMRQQGEHQWSGSKGPGRDHGDDEQEQEQAAAEPPCDSSALVVGVVVRAAELRIGPAGSEFQNIELVR